MGNLIFGSTFVATSLLLLWILQRLTGRRRVHELLRQRNPNEQRATAVKNLSLVERWERQARQAGLDWSSRNYLTLVAGAALVALLLILAGARSLALLVVAFALAAPWGVVWFRRRARSNQFARQLPPALNLMANTVRAGGTMLQAVRSVSRQMPDPIHSEFARIERDLQLQVPLGDALERAAGRIGAPEFTAVVVACKVAGQAGADLDVILDHIAHEIVEDRQFQDAMKAAGSESRTSAKIVTVFPILIAVVFYWKSPRYFDPLLHDPAGQLMLIFCGGALVLGWFILHRLADIRAW